MVLEQYEAAKKRGGHVYAEPECDLDLIASGPRDRRVNRVLSNSFGFGGINACVVLGSAQRAEASPRNVRGQRPGNRGSILTLTDRCSNRPGPGVGHRGG